MEHTSPVLTKTMKALPRKTDRSRADQLGPLDASMTTLDHKNRRKGRRRASIASRTSSLHLYRKTAFRSSAQTFFEKMKEVVEKKYLFLGIYSFMQLLLFSKESEQKPIGSS